MADTASLTITDKRDLALQAGMQLIPYVGGPLCTLYFGAKQEKRFQRLESFYREVAAELNNLKEPIRSVDQQNPVALESILESLNEKVEVEHTTEKREFFKSYLKNTLRFPVAGNFDERKYFLETLADMTLLECELLATINSTAGATQVGAIQKPETDQYAIVGAIGRLKSSGFLTAVHQTFTVGGGDNSLLEMVQLSSYGKRFYEFCISGA